MDWVLYLNLCYSGVSYYLPYLADEKQYGVALPHFLLFLSSTKFYRKLKFVDNLTELAQMVPLDQLDIPDAVKQ